MDLNILWFFLLGVLLIGYAVLDGFDFGVGMLHLLGRKDGERMAFIRSIGPIWDGNEVWLVTFGGAMFAAFPEAYATAFSGFYIPFMLLLFALILRAVSLEFRSKIADARWASIWDTGFFFSSGLASVLFGAAVGAVMVGVPLNSRGIFEGSVLDILFPASLPIYPVTTAALTVALFCLHGALYLQLKITGPLHQRIRRWVWHAFGSFLVLYLFATVVTLIALPHASKNFERFPVTWLAVLFSIGAIANIPRSLFLNRERQAFISSSALIASLVMLVGVCLFPNLIMDSSGGEGTLTVYNAASSEKTLGIMAIIAGLGMPFVLAYTAIIYWTFRHRVAAEED